MSGIEPRNKSSIQEISDEELSALTNAIKIRYGFDFTNYEKKSLKRGFSRLIAKYELENLLGLWSKVLKDRQFILGCIDDLTVNLTELFRNPEIWIKLRDNILPQYLSNPQLSVWHAGCSTGEEIYTMAFILDELGFLKKTKSLGTDLSLTALNKAREGIYPQIIFNRYLSSFRKFFKEKDTTRFFDLTDDFAEVKMDFKKHIVFERHNLVQDPMNKKFDIILCRNVMIYFDDVLKIKVLKLFHSCLKDDGYFIIGYYDMLPDSYKEFFTLADPVTRIYRKASSK